MEGRSSEGGSAHKVFDEMRMRFKRVGEGEKDTNVLAANCHLLHSWFYFFKKIPPLIGLVVVKPECWLESERQERQS